MILGIDPGAKGGVAVVELSGQLIDGYRMPTMKLRGKTLVDVVHLDSWLSLWAFDTAVIESVHAMPGQGVSSCFSFGRATGAVEALTMLIADKQVWVAPQAWKKHFGLAKEKQASLDLARMRFGTAFKWTKKADDGIAEAALMVLYWLEKQRARIAA
jgi:Holliday junction resolvasome RuvABC endonuclease subunit